MKVVSWILTILFVITPCLALAQTNIEPPVNPTPPGTPAPRNFMFEGMVNGRMAAENEISGGRWFVAGIISGVGLGLIGTTGITITASLYSTDPPLQRMMMIQHENATYQMAFLMEYKHKARSKRTWPALGGGLLGTALFVAAVMSAQN